MRWKSWWPCSPPSLRVVAGLDVSTQGCQLVILSGAPAEASGVRYAGHLEIPEGWIREGQIVQAELFGCWLRDYLAQGGFDVGALRMGIDDAWISRHELTLASGLSEEDVAFQVSVEVQAWMSEVEVCVDFQPIQTAVDSEEPSLRGSQTYQIRAVPRSFVAPMVDMAKSAKLDLVAAEGHSDARACVQRRDVFKSIPTVSVGLALQCDVAFGLALGAWQRGSFNFLPYRARAQDVRRHAWCAGIAAWAVGGMVLAASLTWMLSALTDRKQLHMPDVVAVRRALEAASQAHREAQTMHQLATEQRDWLLNRQALHEHTLQWARVLNQSTQGVWVSAVTQQGVQWGVQGEALTSVHAQELMAQLNQLDIWGRAPEMRQLQVLRAPSTTGLPVWQFRVEAELKGGQ